jgi:hypothetical protein
MSRTFDSGIIPLLGFFLLRWTPLMDNAVWDWRTGHHVVDFEWFSVCLPFLLDHSPMTKLGTAVRRLADELACRSERADIAAAALRRRLDALSLGGEQSVPRAPTTTE